MENHLETIGNILSYMAKYSSYPTNYFQGACPICGMKYPVCTRVVFDSDHRGKGATVHVKWSCYNGRCITNENKKYNVFLDLVRYMDCDKVIPFIDKLRESHDVVLLLMAYVGAWNYKHDKMPPATNMLDKHISRQIWRNFLHNNPKERKINTCPLCDSPLVLKMEYCDESGGCATVTCSNNRGLEDAECPFAFYQKDTEDSTFLIRQLAELNSFLCDVNAQME